jgi:hypothetical protein
MTGNKIFFNFFVLEILRRRRKKLAATQRVEEFSQNLNEPLLLLGDVMSGGAVDNSLVGIHRIVRAFVFLREIFALVTRLMSIDENCHENEKQENDEQDACERKKHGKNKRKSMAIKNYFLTS